MAKKSTKTIEEKTKKKSLKKEEETEKDKAADAEEDEEKEEEKDDVPSPAKTLQFEGILDEAFGNEPEETPLDLTGSDEESDDFSEEEMGAEWEE